MSETNTYIRNRTARSMYEHYVSGGENRDNKGRFERADDFRQDLSQYSIKDGTIVSGSSCKWDAINCSGVPIDYDNERAIVYADGSDAHTLLIGSTGSKKSRLVVMPTVRILASANENMIICDPKGEIYRRTVCFLEENDYKIHVINLREPQKGDGWNMLAVPYELYCNGEIDKACEFINDMALNLIPIESKDPYWDYSARDVLFGLILLLFKISKQKQLSNNVVNMENVIRLKEELFFSHDSSRIQNSSIWRFAKEDSLIRMRLNGTIICPEKTLSCIISTFDQHMSCFLLQPQLTEMLSISTFDVHDFGFGKNALFLIMPDEKTTFHKIVTIFVKQIYELLIENAFKKTEENRFPSRINFILDEFSSLPPISDFPQMIAASRSRNIRFMLIVQSKHQLKQRYADETSTIMSNCGNWMFLTSREIELLREVSELCGVVGVNKEPLVSVSRLQHLDKYKGECLIFNGRKHPYVALLPDIDLYDNFYHPQVNMEVRKPMEHSELEYGYFGTITKNHFDEMIDVPRTDDSQLDDEVGLITDGSKLSKKLKECFDDAHGSSEGEES